MIIGAWVITRARFNVQVAMKFAQRPRAREAVKSVLRQRILGTRSSDFQLKSIDVTESTGIRVANFGIDEHEAADALGALSGCPE